MNSVECCLLSSSLSKASHDDPSIIVFAPLVLCTGHHDQPRKSVEKSVHAFVCNRVSMRSRYPSNNEDPVWTVSTINVQGVANMDLLLHFLRM